MMPIVISEAEKIAMQDYFNYPERYTDGKIEALTPGRSLPNGTKISRAKFSLEWGNIPRQFIIPTGVDGEAIYIPILSAFSDDLGTHAATILNGKIYFHQNKDDLPKILPDNFSDFCEIDEDEDPEDPSIIEYKMAWERTLGKPDYNMTINLGLFKKTVKFAVDLEGNAFYLKSHSSVIEGDVSLPNDAEQYAPNLYMGPSIYRTKIFDHYTLAKRIDITRDSGENLHEFMLLHQDDLSPIQIQQLAREILKQFLVQIQEKGIVHTDIKAENICVKITQRAEQPFEVVFIDFEEAFRIEAPSARGNGTPGYMAPEFFKTFNDFEKQLENRGTDLSNYFNTLKPNFKNLFSKASDIYSLGFVLLNDLLLDDTSDFYHLAHSMCHSEADNRPSADDIHAALLHQENTIDASLNSLPYTSFQG